MKIVYLTDIHDALKELRVLLSTTEADLYLLSGDILYKAFYDDDKVYEFVCLQEDFWSLARNLKKKIVPFDLASDILRFPENYDNDDKLQKKATEYRQLFEKATKNMKDKYETIEGLIQKFSNAESVMLPGNYDIDLRYTALRDRDMHQHEKTISGMKFAGYGGAPIATSGIPEKLAVGYHEKTKDGQLFSEPQDYFEEQNPDVLLVHNPAYGFFDRVPGIGHVGSQGTRNYLDQYSPLLIVSGHVHEDYGVAMRNGTVFLNPSNFGGVDSPYGWQAGGAYAEVYVEKDAQGAPKIQTINIMRLVEDRSVTLAEIDLSDGQPRQTTVEENREHAHIDLDVLVRDSSGAVP
ncbi:MAG: metallophosphoesterase [bacterium]|nr:metallophosphoesterase [bacterium]